MSKVFFPAIWMFLAASAFAASFDCTSTANSVEKFVCNNPTISSLDSRLGTIYVNDMSKASDEQRERLVREQRHWLKFSRNSCRDETCFKHAYWSRLSELETFFNRESLPKSEAERAETFKQTIASSPLFLTDWSSPQAFCNKIFGDLKQMKGVTFLEPVARAQSYEDEALDPWKRECHGKAPLHFSYRFCGRNISPDDNKRQGGLKNCTAGYGLPPFKIFELPPLTGSTDKRYVFYSESDYGPMNGGNAKLNGGGASGYQQIDIKECRAQVGYSVPTSRSEPDGTNESAIIEYEGRYYILTVARSFNAYWVTVNTGSPMSGQCVWSPVKPKTQQSQ